MAILGLNSRCGIKKHQLCENSLTAIHYTQDYAHKFCQFKSYTTGIICICLIDKKLQNIYPNLMGQQCCILVKYALSFFQLIPFDGI